MKQEYKMKRLEFYKEYYRITNNTFSDHIIWSSRSNRAKEAWKKGQTLTSKFGRKVFLTFGYLLLIVGWLPVLFSSSLWFINAIIGLLFIWIREYSLIKVEYMYQIYKKNSQYSKIIIDSFFCNLELDPLVRLTKKCVKGFIRENLNTLKLKYKALFKDRNNKVILIFYSHKVKIVINNKNFELTKLYNSRDEIIIDIANIINKEIEMVQR